MHTEERVWLTPLPSTPTHVDLGFFLGGCLTQLRAPPPLGQLPEPVGALPRGLLEGRGPHLPSHLYDVALPDLGITWPCRATGMWTPEAQGEVVMLGSAGWGRRGRAGWWHPPPSELLDLLCPLPPLPGCRGGGRGGLWLFPNHLSGRPSRQCGQEPRVRRSAARAAGACEGERGRDCGAEAAAEPGEAGVRAARSPEGRQELQTRARA